MKNSSQKSQYVHLPAGVNPGKQTINDPSLLVMTPRQSKRGRLLSTGFIALVVGIFTLLASYADLSVQPVVIYSAALFLLAVATTSIYWQVLPWSGLRVLKNTSIKPAQTHITRGSMLKFIVERKGSIASKKALRVDVGIECIQRHDIMIKSRYGSHKQTMYRPVYESWSTVLLTPGMRTVTVQVPKEQAFSFEGTHISFNWHVAIRARLPLQPDRKKTVPIWVRPY